MNKLTPTDESAMGTVTAEAPDKNGWMPIETAPKDTAVLLYALGYYVGHWNTATERWWTYTDGTKTAGERLLNTWSPPTHWQSLPNPPKE